MVLFIISKTGNNLNVLQLANGQINWYLHITEDHSTININELLIHTMTLMQFRRITLSERNHIQKATSSMISFLYSGNGIITGTKDRSVIAKVGEEVDYKGTLWGNF